MNTIFTMVMVFMTTMGDRGYKCEIEEIMENTAIVACHNKHNFVVEWMDIRENQNILMDHGRVI